MSSMDDIRKGAVAVLSLAAIDLTALAVVATYKTAGVLDLTGNATADKFITGLTLFATFITIVIIAIVGKTVIGLFKGSN